MPVPSVVQTASNTGTTSPVAVTLSATTAGNCLVVCVGEGNSTTNPTVSGITLGGAAGNFAIVPGASVANNADANVEIWTDQNCAGGQTAVSVSFNAGTGAGNGYTVWVFEIANVLTSSAVDTKNAAGAASGAWSSGSTGTLAQPNEIAIGVGAAIGSIGAPTLTGPSSPWSNQAQLTAARTAMIAGTQVVSATTALTYAGTTTTGRVGAAIITLLGTASVSGTVQPETARPAPRRRLARALIGFRPVATVNGIPPAGTVQPGAARPAPRRRPARALTAFVPVATVNANPVAGTVQPQAAQPARRRTLVRAIARGLAVQGARGQAPAQRFTLPPRRRRARAVVRFTAVAGSVAPPAPKTLLISLASAAGTDDYGTAYPQGILATAGVIEGPQFIGNDFVLNTSGFFLYSGTPGAGNLIQSIAPSSGADSFGNNYVAGAASYQSGLASAVTAGAFTTYSGSLGFGWSTEAVIETNGSGDLILLAAGGRQVITANNILDGGGGGATFQADVSVNGVNLNVGNGSNAKINLNPQMATPPNFPTAGTTLAQTQACLDAFIQSFRNRGMVN